MTARRGPARAAYAAAALAFASAAVTAYWALGGTLLLDTVGGAIEELARERSTGALALAAVVVLAKVAAGVLALALVRPRRTPSRSRRRLLATVSLAGGTLLALYGGVLVAVGALVLVGAITPSGDVDEHALRWHVFLWDLWFALWGLALAVAGAAVRRAPIIPAPAPAARPPRPR